MAYRWQLPVTASEWDLAAKKLKSGAIEFIGTFLLVMSATSSKDSYISDAPSHRCPAKSYILGYIPCLVGNASSEMQASAAAVQHSCNGKSEMQPMAVAATIMLIVTVRATTSFYDRCL